jgi:hypothetical protein
MTKPIPGHIHADGSALVGGTYGPGSRLLFRVRESYAGRLWRAIRGLPVEVHVHLPGDAVRVEVRHGAAVETLTVQTAVHRSFEECHPEVFAP